MKKTFTTPAISIDKFDIDVITTSGNYTGYQRVIDSLKNKSLNTSANIVDWYAE